MRSRNSTASARLMAAKPPREGIRSLRLPGDANAFWAEREARQAERQMSRAASDPVAPPAEPATYAQFLSDRVREIGMLFGLSIGELETMASLATLNAKGIPIHNMLVHAETRLRWESASAKIEQWVRANLPAKSPPKAEAA